LLSVSWLYLALDGVYHPFELHFQATRLYSLPHTEIDYFQMGLAPAMGSGPVQGDFESLSTPEKETKTLQVPTVPDRRDSALGFSHFTRRYSGNPC